MELNLTNFSYGTPILSTIFIDMFEQFSNNTTKEFILPSILKTDPLLVKLLELIYKKAEQPLPNVIGVKYNLPVPKTMTSNKKIIIGFTGGKDSTIIMANLLSEGFKPIPVYIDGINRCYPSEKDRVLDICLQLKVIPIVIKLKISGSMSFLSNPFKNGLIMAIMFDIGYYLNVHRFALGNHSKTKIKDTSLDSTISDSSEFISECASYAKKRLILNLEYYSINCPIYKIYVLLNRYNLLNSIQSCISTHRYQKYLREQNIKKFKIKDSLDYRCYSCYKCCQEYLILTHHDIMDHNYDLIKHCLKILRNKWSHIVLPNKPNIQQCSDNQILDLIVSKY